jgi:uncharacterized membrane protein (DUF485 family)
MSNLLRCSVVYVTLIGLLHYEQMTMAAVRANSVGSLPLHAFFAVLYAFDAFITIWPVQRTDRLYDRLNRSMD